MAKMTFDEGLERVVAALRKAGHEALVQPNKYVEGHQLVVDGTSLHATEAYSADSWPGVRLGFDGSAVKCGYVVNVTKTGKIDLGTIREAVSTKHKAVAIQTAKDGATKVFEEVSVSRYGKADFRSVQVDDESVVRGHLQIDMHRVRADKLRPIMEAIAAVVGSGEDV